MSGAVVLAGGTGLVGRALAVRLRALGRDVRLVSRTPRDPDTYGWGQLPEALAGAAAVVNLAGEGIADRRWSPARKVDLMRSRLVPTTRLVAALASAPVPVLVNASAIGYYEGRLREAQTEEAGPGSDYLADLCQAWEAEARQAESLGTRVVLLRTGIVLAREGGALPRMARPFRLGLGAPLGSGQQGMSWIHLEDLVEMILWALGEAQVTGPLNATAPAPASNRDFSRILARVLRRPCWPLPGFLTEAPLRLALGEMAEAMLLQGPRVLPAKALSLGYRFRHPDLEASLRQLLA